MEISQLKSDEQMQTMLMMIQMEKLSHLCGNHNDVSNIATSMQPHYTNQNLNPNNIPSPPPSSFLNLTSPTLSLTNSLEQSSSHKRASMAAMREMIFRIASMQPIHIDAETVKPPKRRNVKISKDPQSVAARHRRERISERIRILQRIVPGGTKMDTASMLDEAIHYLKFLKSQVDNLEKASVNNPNVNSVVSQSRVGFPVAMSSGATHYHAHLPQLHHNLDE